MMHGMTERSIDHSSPGHAAKLARRAAMDCVALAQHADDRDTHISPTLDLIAEDLLQLSRHLSLLDAALNSSLREFANRRRGS
jgi:hypothetical protein